MASRFAWIDTDEASRRTMLDFVDQFRDQGTLDELGIGTIRDAFADYFFPGTTTVQTRARYFLFVPWIYRRLEDRRVASEDMSYKLREGEFALLNAMLEAGVGDGERLIGRQSKASLKRWPSNIYWNGLAVWGIRKFSGSQDAYHRGLNAFYERNRNATVDPEEDLGEVRRVNWDSDPHFPKPPEGFPKGATMDLRKEDAEYLWFKIRTTCDRSLLSKLLDDPTAVEAEAIWAIPRLGELPGDLQKQIDNAKWFAQAVQGASLLYYWSVASTGGQTKLAEEGESALVAWAVELDQEWSGFSEWGTALKEFWNGPALLGARISDRTQRFVENWVGQLVKRGSGKEIWTQEPTLQLIRDRERQTKTEARARLWNAQQRERWEPTGLPRMLDYRWGIAGWILGDIYAGLQAKASLAVEGA